LSVGKPKPPGSRDLANGGQQWGGANFTPPKGEKLLKRSQPSEGFKNGAPGIGRLCGKPAYSGMREGLEENKWPHDTGGLLVFRHGSTHRSCTFKSCEKRGNHQGGERKGSSQLSHPPLFQPTYEKLIGWTSRTIQTRKDVWERELVYK